MCSNKYQKWISKEMFYVKGSNDSMFSLKDSGIICKVCHWFFIERKASTNIEKIKPFVTVPAVPSFCKKLLMHKNSKNHKNAYSYYIKCKVNNTSVNKINTCNIFTSYKKQKNSKLSKNFFNNNKKNINNTSSSNFNYEMKKKINENIKNINLFNCSKQNFTIIIWMIQNNIPLFKLSSLHKLIKVVSNDKSLIFFSHNSSVNIKEYMSILNKNHKDSLINSFEKYKYFSIMVDDSIDISTINHMSIFIKYIDNSFTIRTNFLALKEIGDKGAASYNLFNILISVLKEFNLNFKSLVAFCGDGTRNISGNKKGLLNLIKQNNPYLIGVHCYAHQFNLIIKSLFIKNVELCEIKNKIYKIIKYINSSENRLSLFHNIQNNLFSNIKKKKIILPIEIRWSSMYNSLQSIIENYLVIKLFFKQLNKNKNVNKEEIIEFIKIFDDSEFIRKILVLESILRVMNQGIQSFQKENINIDDGIKIIFDTKTKLKNLSNIEMIKNIQQKMETTVKNIDKNELYLKIENQIEENVNFIFENINIRFNKKEDLLEKIITIFDPKKIKEYLNNSEVNYKQTFISIIQKFKPIFFENNYNDKYEDFRLFIESISSCINLFKNSTEVCKYVLSKSTLGNCITIIRLAQIFLLIPVTTVAVERGFSCLNTIKSKKRNNLNQTSLNTLMMIKINQTEENMKELIEKCSEDWVKVKQRRTALSTLKSINKKIYYKNNAIANTTKITRKEKLNFQGLELANHIENNNMFFEKTQKNNEIEKLIPTNIEGENFVRMKIKRKRISQKQQGKKVDNKTLKKGFKKKLIITNIYSNEQKI
jgi:hypothetical protein